jgi:hypothetical protein
MVGVAKAEAAAVFGIGCCGREGYECWQGAGRLKAGQAIERGINVTVKGLSGAQIASFCCSPDDTIYEVKQRLLQFSGDGSGFLQLVQGTLVLQDSHRLSACALCRDTEEPSLTVTCVRRTVSSLATLADSMLSDVADSVMRCEYALAERSRPAADAVAKAFPRDLRAKMIAWLIAAFDVLEFDSELLGGAVFTLDRYCVAKAACLDERAVGLALLAAISTEMKLSGKAEFSTTHIKRLIQHLCQGRFEMLEILRTERKVLSTLDFEVGSPTSFTFFAGLQMRLQKIGDSADGCASWVDLAEMLLRLALLDADFQYGHCHALIAASALSASLSICGAPVALRTALIEDLEAYRSAECVQSAEEAVLGCEWELLRLWQAGLNGKQAMFYQAVHAVFVTPQRHNVAGRFEPAQRLKELEGASQMEKQRMCKRRWESGISRTTRMTL